MILGELTHFVNRAVSQEKVVNCVYSGYPVECIQKEGRVQFEALTGSQWRRKTCFYFPQTGKPGKNQKSIAQVGGLTRSDSRKYNLSNFQVLWIPKADSVPCEEIRRVL